MPRVDLSKPTSRHATRAGTRARRRGPITFAASCATIVACVALSGCHPRPQPGAAGAPPIRAIWVTRWDYKSAGDIRKIMHNCRAAGFNTVLFQVRGNATAFYRSKIEPWADELGGRDPGFDPLKTACREAHRRGLALHAWVNVMPGWFGDEAPSNPRQLYRARPAWFWRDTRGHRQPLGWYSSVNPCYPEVRKYLVAVMKEIVKGYDIDGLHLDYIRFPNEWHSGYARGRPVPDYPRDARTLALFKHDTGTTPAAAPDRWNRWRADQVTKLLRGIRTMVRRVKPTVRLSAAVGASQQDAMERHFQDSRRWLAEGLLDAVYPMNYTKNMGLFLRRLDAWSSSATNVPVVVGVMVDGRDASIVVKQLDAAQRRCRHFAAFAYNSMFERFDEEGRPIGDKSSGARAALRKRVIPYLRALANART